MERLPKDVLFKTFLDLSPVDLISLSATDKYLNEKISKSNEFWSLKLQKDYPYVYKNLKKPVKNAKSEYIKNFTYIAKIIEKGYSHLLNLFNKDFLEFLDIKKYKKSFFKKTYKEFENMKLSDYGDSDDAVDDYLYDLSVDVVESFLPSFSYDVYENRSDEINNNLKKIFYMFFDLWFYRQSFSI